MAGLRYVMRSSRVPDKAHIFDKKAFLGFNLTLLYNFTLNLTIVKNPRSEEVALV
jgi:hypothetical protein